MEETLLSRILLSAEKRVQTREGAAALLADPNSLATVTDALKRPASGNLYTQWAASLELKRAVGTAARLLRFCSQVRDPYPAVCAHCPSRLTIGPRCKPQVTNLLKSLAACTPGGLSAWSLEDRCPMPIITALV